MGKGKRLRAMRQQSKDKKKQQPKNCNYARDIDSWYGIPGKEGVVQTVLTGDDIRSLLQNEFYMATYTLKSDIGFPISLYCMSASEFANVDHKLVCVSHNIPLEDIRDDEEYNCNLLFLTLKSYAETPENIDLEVQHVHYLFGMEVLSKVSEEGAVKDDLANMYIGDMIRNKLYVNGAGAKKILEMTL